MGGFRPAHLLPRSQIDTQVGFGMEGRTLAVALLAMVMTIPVGAHALLVDPTPDTTAPLALEGSGFYAEVSRDQWGIAHIYADDTYSLFYANGYVQAADRLAAMDVLRHVARGELASLTGPSGLEMDLLARRELYTLEEQQAAFEALSVEWQTAFQGFADGVNQYIKEALVDPTKMPVEYPALAEYPEEWKVTDTVAIAQYLLDIFGRGGGGAEHSNVKLLATLRESLGELEGDAAFTDFVWSMRSNTYTTIKPQDVPASQSWQLRPEDLPHDLQDLDAAQMEAITAAAGYEDVDDTMAPIGETMAALGWPFKMGSNAQLLSPQFAENGNAMLYGGPQMGYFNPMIPYEVGLHGAGFDAVGMGVTGAPGVIIGRAAGHAFTITSGSVDQVDLVVERLVDDAYHYEVDGEVLEMDCRTETHIVRPGPPDYAPGADPAWRPPMPDIVEQEVCRTIHGPVLGRTADGQYAFASYRSYRGEEVDSGVLWLQVGKTTDIESFQDLFENFKFTFNFNYADDQGNIMYMHVGAQPVRDDRLDPRMPMPGWDSSYDWKDILTGRDLPNVRNPTSGHTVNWNNNPAKHFPTGDMREKWGLSHRATLMADTLGAKIAEKGTLNMDDLRAVHEYASTHDPYARNTYDLLHAAAVASGDTDALAAAQEWAATGFAWTPDPAIAADEGSPDGYHYAGLRLYEIWRSALQTTVFEDEMGNHTAGLDWNPIGHSDPHAANHGEAEMPDTVLLDTVAGDASRNWCDDITTAAEESCADASLLALVGAIADEPDWAAPFPLRHSKFTALGAAPAFEIPMTNRPSFQHFYDWGLPESDARSRNAVPPGVSAHMNAVDYLMVQGWLNGVPGAQPPVHMVDQLQTYIDFEDKPLLFARDLVDQYEASWFVLGDAPCSAALPGCT